MSRQADPIPRPAARVLVIDQHDRVLLIHTQLDPDHPRPLIWLVPGGGLDPGETREQGARRELWEETGLRADALHPVWDRRHVFTWRGTRYEQQERYFLTRVQTPLSLRFAKLEEIESQQLLDFRWWHSDEIQSSDEVFVPSRLGPLLATLLSQPLPSEITAIDP